MIPTASPASLERPAYESTYAQLRRELLSNAIEPGVRLREVEIAKRLDVSRTPVREALRRLESDGFVERDASGARVATPSGPDDAGDIGLLRVEIDGLAARLAAERASEDDWAQVFFLVAQLRTAADDQELAHLHRLLHRDIYALAFSPRMTAFFSGQLLPYIEEVVNVGPGRRSDGEGAFRQHLALVRALSSGDAGRAVEASRDHAASGARYAKSDSGDHGPVAGPTGAEMTTAERTTAERTTAERTTVVEGTGPSDPLRHYWHPVGWASALGAGPMATVLLDERIVVWRTSDGAVHAAEDRCLHRGTALSLGTVDRDCLVCPYHGWRFGPDGSCVGIPQLEPGAAVPSRARIVDFCCEERYGLLWVCLATPVADIPVFPEWDNPAYRHVECPAYTWSSSAPRMVENFTDFGHLGWLHDGYLGTKDDLVIPPHTVTDTGPELHYTLTMTVPNTNNEFAVTDLADEVGQQTNTYVLTLPHVIWLQCTYHGTDTHRTLFFAAQPRSATESTGYCYQSRDFDADGDDRAYADFQDLLAEQDRPIVESQDPRQLPLVLAEELHLPFDRVAIAYRRALRRIGECG